MINTNLNDLTSSLTPDLINKVIHHSFKNFVVMCFKTLNPNIQFIDNWHIDLIVNYLKSTIDGQTKRLIINIPPRSLKSTIISVAWPAWLMGQDPTKRVIVASYSQSLSLKHSEDCRQIMQSAWYKQIFPATKIRRGSNLKNKFITTQNGFRFATSIGGTLTGEGADVLIVDDPHTPLQAESDTERTRALDWFDRTFVTRLDDKKSGTIIVIMQRLHKQDLTGHLLQKRNWQHLCLPATTEIDTNYKIGTYSYNRKAGQLLNPNREGQQEIETAKLELGSYGFNAQYLQQPVSQTGSIIKYIWLKRYELTAISISSFEGIYQSWDCAIKIGNSHDYTVCTTWGIINNQYYLINVLRQKYEFPDLKRAIIATTEVYNPHAILIEDKASGQALIQELKKSSSLPIIAINPTRDKTVRLLTVSSLFEANKVFLPHSASWLAEYEQELLNFPNTEHDDMVDSTTQFLEWIRSKKITEMKLRLI